MHICMYTYTYAHTLTLAYNTKVNNFTKTKTSRNPSPSNPNFLERFMIEVDLPVNPIYAQPLFLRAVDVRLGGYKTPVVGVGVIDMASKIPGSPTYVPPQEVEMYTDKKNSPVGQRGSISAADAQNGLDLSAHKHNDPNSSGISKGGGGSLVRPQTGGAFKSNSAKMSSKFAKDAR